MTIATRTTRLRRAALAAAAASAIIVGLSACVTVNPGGGTGMPMGDLPEGVNTADVAFVQMMIPHHERAVEMSDLLLEKEGIDPEVVELATAIKQAQGPEIELMKSWLDDWGVPSMMSGGGMDGMNMGSGGGMDDADMDALADAEGADASRLFLESMSEHHAGAVDMAENVLDDGESKQVADLARDIIETQQAEIEIMRELLG